MSSMETDGIEVAPRTSRKVLPQFLQPVSLQAQNGEKWIIENHMTNDKNLKTESWCLQSFFSNP